jgi:cycloartenol synthase
MYYTYAWYIKFITIVNKVVRNVDALYIDIVLGKNITTVPGLYEYFEDKLLSHTTTFDNTYYMVMILIFSVTCLYIFSLYLLSKPFGYPGGPRKRKSRRQPKFFNTNKSFFQDVEKNGYWKFAEVDDETVALPEAKLLTGEIYGRHRWVYVPHNNNRKTGKNNQTTKKVVFNPSINPNASDLIFRNQKISQQNEKKVKGVKKSKPLSHLEKAMQFYQKLQCNDGHWGGDYGGPMFLMPGLIIVNHVTKTPTDEILSKAHKDAMIYYLKCHQQIDGGWGTHIESASTMFGTVLSYVSLRLLGLSKDDPVCKLGRKFILTHGGALYTSSWAKFWLAVLGLYDWKGINAIPPEMWLLPDWFPFHPGRLWCHCRMVYLPMCYIYGKRYVYENAENDPIIVSLKKEMYIEKDFDKINWDNARHKVADIDNYSPITMTMKFLHHCLAYFYESYNGISCIREKGLKFALEYMDAEDVQTNYIDIGPVNKTMNMLSMWISEGQNYQSKKFQRHISRVYDYLWIAEDGMKMQGYNGSQCWDTSFAIQGILEAKHLITNDNHDIVNTSLKVYEFLERTQILSTTTSQNTESYIYETDIKKRKRYYRHVSQGGWPFSTSAHGWPISDCTAEGLKAVLNIHKDPIISNKLARNSRSKECNLVVISAERLYNAVNVLLTLQNPGGGWATYEQNRGYSWYEILNPSEVFGDIMIDYPYVECSSASVTALMEFQHQYPNHRAVEIKNSIKAGIRFIKSIQRPDGSWYGSWGCCFTYGTWFGIEALTEYGESLDQSYSVRMAVNFLLQHQNKNGGWGEDFSSCYNKAYASNGAELYGDEEGSAIVQTSWALLGLLSAFSSSKSPAMITDRKNLLKSIDDGVKYLKERQEDNGDWKQEGITGVFNRACGITYTAYRNVFPIWALSRYESLAMIDKKEN